MKVSPRHVAETTNGIATDGDDYFGCCCTDFSFGALGIQDCKVRRCPSGAKYRAHIGDYA
jgi:hypothetical protein